MIKGSNGRNTKAKNMSPADIKEHENLLREIFSGNDGKSPLMHQLARTVWSYRLAYEKSLGFSGPQVWILMMLSKKEPQVGLTQSELTRIMRVDAGAITRLVKTMEEKEGWITRQPDPKDNRLTRVFLTDKGREVIKGLPERSREMEQRITRNLTEQQINELRQILTILDRTSREEYEDLKSNQPLDSEPTEN